jgi:hypothetical protein
LRKGPWAIRGGLLWQAAEKVETLARIVMPAQALGPVLHHEVNGLLNPRLRGNDTETGASGFFSNLRVVRTERFAPLDFC